MKQPLALAVWELGEWLRDWRSGFYGVHEDRRLVGGQIIKKFGHLLNLTSKQPFLQQSTR
jgi:hypothetical protein